MENSKEIKKFKKWLVNFVEYATYGDFAKSGWEAGRIELIPLDGDMEKDKLEIDNIRLPRKLWLALRKEWGEKRIIIEGELLASTHKEDEDWERKFRDDLEEVLDEYFPKIEEEGEAKRANKRGAALMLYSEAVILARKYVQSARNSERERVMEMIGEIKEWPEPQEGAGEELGPLAGAGMYMQYEFDRKKHKEQLSDLEEKLKEASKER